MNYGSEVSEAIDLLANMESERTTLIDRLRNVVRKSGAVIRAVDAFSAENQDIEVGSSSRSLMGM